MLADAFDHGEGTAVSDGEAFSSAASNKELAGSGAVEHRVAGKNVAAPGSGQAGGDGDGSAGEAFANVVVGFALELQRYALGEKCAEALASRAVKSLFDLVIAGKAVLAAAHQFPAQAGANAAIRVLNGLRLILEPEGSMKMKRFLKCADVESRLLLRRNTIGGRDRNDQERIHSGAGAEAVVPAGELAEGTHTKLREAMAHFFGERTEVGDDHFGFAGESGAELFVLRGDSDGASIEMALARHDATDGEERGGAKAEFVGAKNGGQDDIAGEFQASVHAERET